MSPVKSYLAAQREIDDAVARVLTSGTYILGPEVAAFEHAFANWLGAPFAVGCANGTDAIVLAIKACGIEAGSKIATVSHTAVASVAAIELAGCKPVLLDVAEDEFTVDVQELALLLARESDAGDPVKAVLAVHLYGQPASIRDIRVLCDQHGAVLIEDCSQAHGARVDRQRVGTFGRAATFSFYPTKNLGAFGDGGAVVTADPAVAQRLRRLREYGWDSDRLSREPGMNSRLDELQAAILSVKLASLDRGNARRRVIAGRYDAAFRDLLIQLPAQRRGQEGVFHQYVIRSPRRDDLRRLLLDQGVATGIHYETPVHAQPAYMGRVSLGPSCCYRTEQLCREILSLPISPEMTDSEVSFVCGAMIRCQ